MSDFAEFGEVVAEAVVVGIVPGDEHLRGAESGARFKEGLPVDGARVGLDAKDFDVEHLDARGAQVRFDFADHRRVADHVPLRFGRRGGNQTDADVAVARLGGAEHLIGGRDVEHRERGETDGARKLEGLKLAVFKLDGLHFGLGRAGEAGTGGEKGGGRQKTAAGDSHGWGPCCWSWNRLSVRPSSYRPRRLSNTARGRCP